MPTESIVSLVVWFACVLYASIRSSSNTSLGKITGGEESTALAGPKAPKAKPRAEKKKKKAGPATKMKILKFVTLRSTGILYIQFLDKAKNPTKAPPGGSIKFRTNITKPRKGTRSMTKAKWKESKKGYVFVKLPIRQKIVCPPRSYWIRVNFSAGKKRFRAYWRKKFPCLR